jgi:hypothetical protein
LKPVEISSELAARNLFIKKGPVKLKNLPDKIEHHLLLIAKIEI